MTTFLQARDFLKKIFNLKIYFKTDFIIKKKFNFYVYVENFN